MMPSWMLCAIHWGVFFASGDRKKDAILIRIVRSAGKTSCVLP
jgi:hypothetical protein